MKQLGISGVIGGAEYPPLTFDREIYTDYGEKRGKEKKGKCKMEQKRRKIEKREGGKLKMEVEKVTKWGEDFFFHFSNH